MAHTFAQQCVEIAQRFVQEEGVRLANERSSNRDTLTLSSAQLAWLLSQQIADFQHRRGLMNAPIDFRRRHLFQTEIEGEVLIARHVWVERVRLKYHRHVALARGYGFDGYAVHANPARGRSIETGDQPKQCGLSATGRSNDRQNLAIADFQR